MGGRQEFSAADMGISSALTLDMHTMMNKSLGYVYLEALEFFSRILRRFGVLNFIQNSSHPTFARWYLRKIDAMRHHLIMIHGVESISFMLTNIEFDGIPSIHPVRTWMDFHGYHNH